MELKTPEEWCEKYNLSILDPDGWREKDAPSWDTPIDLVDFYSRFHNSTINGFTFNNLTEDYRIAKDSNV